MAMANGIGIVSLYFELQRGTMTKERYQHFLDNLKHILLTSGAAMNEVAVLMDNVPVHNGATCGDADVKYLPTAHS